MIIPFLHKRFYISAKMVIDGNVSSTRPGVIAGVVNGDVNVNTKLIIEKTGLVNGHVTARNLLIMGSVKGNVQCSGKLDAQKSSFISGNVFAAETFIHKDSVIKGGIAHINAKNDLKAAATDEVSLPLTDETAANQSVLLPENPGKDDLPENWF